MVGEIIAQGYIGLSELLGDAQVIDEIIEIVQLCIEHVDAQGETIVLIAGAKWGAVGVLQIGTSSTDGFSQALSRADLCRER